MLKTAVPAIALILAGGIAAAQFAQPIQAQTMPAPSDVSTLALSATAEIQMEPQFVMINAGVETRADTAAAALEENSQMMQRVFAALRRAGLEDEDLQTANLNVQPVYEWISDNRTRVLRGYSATNTVAARVRDTDSFGGVVDAMVRAGANNINSITFGADDTADQMDEARRQAVARLIEKAELFADAAGVELCGIRTMNEQTAYPRAMAPMANVVVTGSRMAQESFSADAPIAAGELTLRATVNATFCIE